MNEAYLNRIENNAREFLSTINSAVSIVAAAKTRSPEEVAAAINGGIEFIGHNYLQEAERMHQTIASSVRWHMIGHLQRNKVKKAVKLFDMIETVDSFELAVAVNKHCISIGKTMPVLLEINSGKESSKTGVLPEHVYKLTPQIAKLTNISIQGLMTMGPRFGNPESARPYFKIARSIFEQINNAGIPGIELRYLSMGMSNSYKIAIEEGANIVRIGTALFGNRNPCTKTK